jgi:phosphoglycolate phosphatase
MDLLIFDLDGTLIDSRLDLAQSVNAARVHMGLGPLDNHLVVSYVGNGAPLLMRRALPEASEAELSRALEFFLRHYAEHALDHTTFYPGVPAALGRLAAAGKHLAVLTNKPTATSRAIMDGLGAGHLFFRVYGGDSFPHKKPDPAGIDALMREAGVERERTMMVGDSSVDIRTGRNAGVQCCGVTWGLQPESLADPAPDLLVDRMEDLAAWVLDNHGETQ